MGNGGWGGRRERGVSERQKKIASIWEEQRDSVMDALLERLNRAQGRRAEAAERCRRAEKGARSALLDDLSVLDGYIFDLQQRIAEHKESRYIYEHS